MLISGLKGLNENNVPRRKFQLKGTFFIEIATRLGPIHMYPFLFEDFFPLVTLIRRIKSPFSNNNRFVCTGSTNFFVLFRFVSFRFVSFRFVFFFSFLIQWYRERKKNRIRATCFFVKL